MLELEVVEARQEAPLIRSLRLARADRAPLPGFEAGAHLGFRLAGLADERPYSLINTDPTPGATAAPATYRIAVRLDEAGRGGSRAMHALEPGARLAATGPLNDFPLDPDGRPVLLAGGIGITPLLSMAAALRAEGRDFTVLYTARSRTQLAFADELRALARPDRLTLRADDEAGGVLDVTALFRGLARGDETLYVCGPAPLIAAVRAEAKARGWSDDRVRFELFGAAAPQADDGAFEVELKVSGKVFTVPPDRSILDVLIEAGEDPLHDCRRGDCGVCQVAVLEGEPDHRDFILSQAERASNRLMQICVSRSRSARLVLDL